MKIWFLRHLQVLLETVGRMAKSPLSNFVAVVVLGIAITLPLLLYKSSQSLQGLALDWRGNPQINIFLDIHESSVPRESDTANSEVIEQTALSLGGSLLKIPTVIDVAYVSAEQALADFREISGFGDVLDDLPGNPLPPMLIVYPDPDLTLNQIDELVQRLSLMPGIDSVNHDQQWMQRLRGIYNLFMVAVIILSTLMAIGVVLIIGNTVRLGILDRSAEIEVLDQIGATSAFIRRPFLYYGLLQGVLGALAGLLFSWLSLSVLDGAVRELARLYDSKIAVGWVTPELAVGIVAGSAILGWLAARVTVANYIRRLRAWTAA